MTATFRSTRIAPLVAAAALLAQCAAPAFCGERPAPDPLGYGGRLWSDLKELPTLPARWSGGQLAIAGGVLGATAGSLMYDEKIRSYNESHRKEFWQNVSFASTHFGDYKYQAPIITALWAGGYAFGSVRMRGMAADAAESSIIAALIINPTICFFTGRRLPSKQDEPSSFRPFRHSGYSFPSGHTSAAFALASSLDIDLRDTLGYWQTPVLYGMAAGVARSRVYDDKHYLSEVILGGGIGWAVGNWVATKHRAGAAGKPAEGKPAVTLLPYFPGGPGLIVSSLF